MGRGRNPVNFVSVADVAVAVARAATDPTLRGHVIEVAGEDLSPTALAGFVTAPGKHPAHLPTPVCGRSARCCDPSGRAWPESHARRS